MLYCSVITNLNKENRIKWEYLPCSQFACKTFAFWQISRKINKSTICAHALNALYTRKQNCINLNNVMHDIKIQNNLRHIRL